MKKITALIVKDSDGSFSCYTPEDTPKYLSIAGYGDTAKEAVEDFYVTLQELKEMAAEQGETIPEAAFTFKYDLQSFFD